MSRNDFYIPSHTHTHTRAHIHTHTHTSTHTDVHPLTFSAVLAGKNTKCFTARRRRARAHKQQHIRKVTPIGHVWKILRSRSKSDLVAWNFRLLKPRVPLFRALLKFGLNFKKVKKAPCFFVFTVVSKSVLSVVFVVWVQLQLLLFRSFGKLALRFGCRDRTGESK